MAGAVPAVTLRPYQRDDLARILAAMKHRKRVLYALPTGGGKTVVAVAAILDMLDRGQRVLFVAHRLELVNQALERLLAAGLPAELTGVIMGADKRANPDAPVQIASIQTVRRRKGLPPFDVAIIDEAHHATADSYKKALKARRVLGLTATPVRLDGKPLKEEFGVLLCGPTSSELIEAGALAQARTWTTSDDMLPSLVGVGTSMGDYKTGELDRAANQPKLVGNLVEHWQKHADGRATVVFATSIDHSEKIRAEFEAAGIRAEHIDGKAPAAERAGIVARLESGETQVVTNCGIYLEGWDAPCIKCVVLARPTKSLALYLQMCGRAVRPWEDIEPIILDHAGNARAHGLPQEDREWSLDAKAKRKSGGAAVWTCPKCFEVVAPLTRECSCGHCFFEGEPPELEPADGELVEAKRRVCECCGVAGLVSRKWRGAWCIECFFIRLWIQRKGGDPTHHAVMARRREREAGQAKECDCCGEDRGEGTTERSALCLKCMWAMRRGAKNYQEALEMRASRGSCQVCGEDVANPLKQYCRRCAALKSKHNLTQDGQVLEHIERLREKPICEACGEAKDGAARLCLMCRSIKRHNPHAALDQFPRLREEYRARHVCACGKKKNRASAQCFECHKGSKSARAAARKAQAASAASPLRCHEVSKKLAAVMVDRRKAGEAPAAIASDLGLTTNTVYRHTSKAAPAQRHLSLQQVAEARRIYKPHVVTWKILGQRYGVSPGCVRQAVLGETWRHITDPPPIK